MRQSDPFLLPFLAEKDQAKADEMLSRIVTEDAALIVKGIVRAKLRVSLNQNDTSYQNQEALDVFGEVQASLINELSALKTGSDGKVIGHFGNYVAVVTYNACSRCLRQKYPARWRLKNALRYLVSHAPQFAAWRVERSLWLVGLASWQSDNRDLAPKARVEELHNNPAVIPAELLNKETIAGGRLVDLLTAIFARVDAPVELDDLVNIIGDWCGVRDQNKSALEISDNEVHPEPSGIRIEDEIDRRAYLRRLWIEISKLPERQRAAILLNLRDADGRSCLELFPLTGVATIRQIAAALRIAADEFAGLWNDLPIDDSSIAERLGITRQQVINLRKSGRERLARRMKGNIRSESTS